MRILQRIFLLIILFVTLVYPVISKDIEKQSYAAADGIDIIRNLKVVASSWQVGAFADYTITFDIKTQAHTDLKNGSLLLTFPAGFDLSYADGSSFTNNSELIDYLILRSEVSETNLTLHLKEIKTFKSFVLEDDSISNETYYQIAVEIDSIRNSQVIGDYQISMLAIKKNNTILYGPALSEQFSLGPGDLVSISVSPSNDTTLKAGDLLQFSASGFDEFGNHVENQEFVWSLVDCSDCLGLFEDSLLHITGVGQARAQAMADGITGLSGWITTNPGDLDRMVLDIDPTQYVGQKLITSGSIILYDAFNNLKTDYDLTANPITLNIDNGTLSPDVLDNQLIQIGGVVRLLMADIVYSGNSITTDIYADNGMVISNSINVSFNRYDILEALNVQGETLDKIFSGHQTTGYFPIENNGNQMVSGYIEMFTYYASLHDTTTGMYLAPQLNSIDTLGIILPVHNGSVSEDTLVVLLKSVFLIENEYVDLFDTGYFPVEILEPSVLNIVEGSFEPNTILVNLPFNISFDIFAEGLITPIDSVVLDIQADFSDNILETVYSGSPQYSSYENGIITYQNLEAVLSPDFTSIYDIVNVPIIVNYRLYSAGNLFTLENNSIDSFKIYFNNGLSLKDASLTPTTVFAGSDVSFSFQLNNIYNFSIEFVAESSGFRIYDGNYATTTNLLLPDDVFLPGENILITSSIYIPEELVGINLEAEYYITYLLPGIPDTLIYQSIFDPESLPIQVIELPPVPQAQILNIEMFAPNSPKVNVGQPFQVAASIANLSEIPLDTLTVKLVSDGPFDYMDTQEIYDVAVSETAVIIFDVIANDISDIADHFHVEILNENITQLPPVNNFVLVVVETPAQVVLSYNLIGADNFLVDYGNHIDLDIALDNLGTAEVTDAAYRIITSGIDMNGTDTLIGRMEVDSYFDINFVTPSFDTTITILFEITEIPIDLNSLQPAMPADTSFEISITVVSAEADLVVESIPVGSNLILPSRVKELFDLKLSNTGFSSVTAFKIEKIILQLKNNEGVSLNIRDNLDIGQTGFYENNIKISSATAGGDLLMFYFDNFILLPGETRIIRLITQFKNNNENSIRVEIGTDGIIASFMEGPNAGMPVTVESTSGSMIISQQMAIKTSDLTGSFMPSNNPFNPNIMPVEFTYELTEDAPVEFRVFTLAGKEVFALDIPIGQPGSLTGENFINWDGRNNDGDIVLNGVYIAIIKNITTGEDARIKIAVVK